MSRLRVLVLAAVAVPALLVGGVWLAPGLLDWNRYRDGIETLASARVGRPVHIGGAITLHLLPQPILTAADVAVEDDGDGIGLRARALRLRVGLGALLSGTVDARELTLQGAELRLPWPLPAGVLAQRPPAWITGLRAQVEDARLQVGAVMLEHIDGTLSTDPETGTLSAAGLGETAAGPGEQGPRRWQFTARMARPARDGAAALDLSLDGQDRLRDTGGTFSGQMGADGTLAGRVTGRGPDLSQVMAAPAVPWRGDGRLSVAGGLAIADDLALEIGGVPAKGTVALRVTPQARLDLSIATGRLDLDAWLPALLARSGGQGGFPTGIDLSAEAASWAGGTLRRLRAALDLTESGVLLREVSAVLPGETRVDLSGQVAAGGSEGPGFTGSVRVASADPRGTVRWLGGVLPELVPELPPEVLRRAAGGAKVVAGGGSLVLSEISGTVDDTAVTGTAAIRTGRRLSITAALALDRLAVQAWVPPALRDIGVRDLGAQNLGALEAWLARLRLVDSDIRLQVGQASWNGLPLGPSALDYQTEANRIVLRRLESQPLGARLSAAGQLGEAGRVAEARLELTAPNLMALRPLLPPGLPAGWDILLRGPGSAVIQASGPPDALAARATLEFADLRIEAQPTLNLVAGRAAGALTVHHPGAPRLLELLGAGGTASWLGDGSFSLVGQFAAAPGRLELTGATLAAGAARATGQVTLEGRRLTGQIAAETLPLPAGTPRSPDPLPLAWLRGNQAALHLEAAQVLVGLEPVLQSAVAELALGDGTLRLSGLTGRVAGGTLTGSATVEAVAEPPRVAVQGQATGLSVPAALAETPIDLLAGQMDVTLDLSASGHSPAALLSTLGGTGAVRVQNGLVQGFDLVAAGAALAVPNGREALDAARQAVLGGTTPITAAETKLELAHGILGLNGTLVADSGGATLTGSIDLRDASEDLRLLLSPAYPAPDAPALGLRVTGAAGSPVRSPELAALARWLAERPVAP